MFNKLRALATRDKDFEVVPFEKLEVNREHFFTKRSNIAEVEDYYCKVFQGSDDVEFPTCYLDKMVIKSVAENYVIVDIFPNTHDRFHRFEKRIPRKVFDSCLYVYSYDKRPYFFIEDEWVDRFWNSKYSSYVFIDLIGFKKYMEQEVELDRELAEEINKKLDKFVSSRADISILSVSDSVILKKNWGIRDDYNDFTPEILIEDFLEIKKIFKEMIGLDSFAVFTQGFNEFSTEDNLRFSEDCRHVSMLTSGAPFVDLMDIEKVAVMNQKNGIHPPCDCYFHDDFFLSLNFKFEHSDWRQNVKKFSFDSRTTFSDKYVPLNSTDVIKKVKIKDTTND
jgi:hypothetical protein